jgi:hypothetical protein
MSGCKAREAQLDNEQQAFLGRIGNMPSGAALPETTVGLPFEPPPPEVRAGSLRSLRPAPPSAGVVPWDTTYVSLSKTELRVPLTGLVLPVPPDAETNGFEERYKAGHRTDYLVVPLAQALERVAAGWKPIRAALGRDPSYAPIVVFADKDAPYRALAEVMYTVGQSGSSPIRVAGRRGAEIVAFDEPKPSLPSSLLSAISDAGDLLTSPFSGDLSGEAMPPGQIEQLIRAHFGEAKRCYRDALARHPGLAGRVVARVEIDTNPRKVTFDRAQTTVTDEDMKTCIAHVLAGIPFPDRDAGQSARVVSVPFNFVKQ